MKNLIALAIIALARRWFPKRPQPEPSTGPSEKERSQCAADILGIFLFTAIFGAPTAMMFDSPHSSDSFLARLFAIVAFSFPPVGIAASIARMRTDDPKKKAMWRRVPFIHIALVILLIILMIVLGAIRWR